MSPSSLVPALNSDIDYEGAFRRIARPFPFGCTCCGVLITAELWASMEPVGTILVEAGDDYPEHFLDMRQHNAPACETLLARPLPVYDADARRAAEETAQRMAQRRARHERHVRVVA